MARTRKKVVKEKRLVCDLRNEYFEIWQELCQVETEITSSMCRVGFLLKHWKQTTKGQYGKDQETD